MPTPPEMPRLKAMTEKRDERILAIARELSADDEAAIHKQAEELAHELHRAGCRDMADNIRQEKAAGRGFHDVKEENIERLAEETPPNPEKFREAVEDIKRLIRKAMVITGKEAFDPDTYLAEWPLWTVVDEEVFKERGALPSFPVIITTEHGKVFPVFTDLDGAKLFIEEMPLPGKVPLKIITPRALREFLANVSKEDCNHVVFDLRGTRGRFYPVSEVLAAIPSDPPG